MRKAFLFSLVSALALSLVLTLTNLGEAASKGKPGGGATNVDPMIVYVAVSSSGPYNELAVANADGSNQTALLSSDQVGYFFPAWSPDFNLEPGFQGSVVFEQWSGSVAAPFIELKIIDVTVTSSGLEIGTPRELVPNASAPAWSRQGDKIAYVSHQQGEKGIHILDLTTGTDTLLIPALDTQDAGWPAWKPDGTQLAYTWYDEIQGVQEVRIKDLIINGDDFPLVSDIGASALDWSPSGTYIAFPGSGAMRIVNATNGDMETLPDTTWAQSPTWTPDENRLAFMNRNGRSGAGKRKIVVRDLTTQVETVIVERNGFHLYEPDWRR